MFSYHVLKPFTKQGKYNEVNKNILKKKKKNKLP